MVEISLLIYKLLFLINIIKQKQIQKNIDIALSNESITGNITPQPIKEGLLT
jgi:hypothetical protein